MEGPHLKKNVKKQDLTPVLRYEGCIGKALSGFTYLSNLQAKARTWKTGKKACGATVSESRRTMRGFVSLQCDGFPVRNPYVEKAWLLQAGAKR